MSPDETMPLFRVHLDGVRFSNAAIAAVDPVPTIAVDCLSDCPSRAPPPLLAMQVHQHLVRHGDGFQLCFDAADVKDKKQRAFPLPNDLVEPIQAYLDRRRPVLLRGKQLNGLWISQYGDLPRQDGFSRELPKVVMRQFGVVMRSHAFRHVAATPIAETDLEHVNIIKDIPGHATLAMAEKHYNRATGISRCNGLQSIVEDIRKNVPKIGRANRGHCDPGKCK